MALEAITLTTTPEQIEKIADGYLSVLTKTGLKQERDKVVDNLRKKAATLHGLDVPSWEAKMTAAAAAAAAPAPAAPAPAPAKRTRRIKLGEPDAPEVVVEVPAEEAKPERGKPTIDPDYFHISQQHRADLNTWLDLNESGEPMHIIAIGPSGCGKTSVFPVIAKERDIPLYKVDCAAVTTIERWLGHKDVQITQDGPQTVYVLSEFLRWVSADGFAPGIVLLDEITRVPPTILNILMSILDGSKSVWVPELGIYVEVHPETKFAATANIGSQFSGTYALDQALRDRFGMAVEMTFPEVEDEVRILEARTGIETAKAKQLVMAGLKTRDSFRNGDLSFPVSTRSLLNAARVVARGRSVMDAALSTFVLHYSDEGGGDSERTAVKFILQGVAGGA